MQLDAFETLLVSAGLETLDALPPRGEALAPNEAARLLALLTRKPVTLDSFPPRLAASHLLREVLEEGDASRGELLRRVERFANVAVLRPDGYLAWARSGRTQQRVGPVQWKDSSFRAGPFELGRFYSARSGAFRLMDPRLREPQGGALAELYDDADYISRTLDGAEESFVELALAIGQLFSTPIADNLAALGHLPAGLAALVASSPEYLERFRHMTRGEQVKALSKLTATLIATWGTAAATTRTLTGALAAAEAQVPVLSLSAQGALMMERVAVPAGRAAAMLSGGPGAALILQRARTASQGASPTGDPGRWGPAKESMSPRARHYQEQISGRSADEAYWVGGMDTRSGGVKFDGFKDAMLLEAKGPGYANKFLDDLMPRVWFEKSGAKALVDQARRQLRAAEGMPIQWHIAEQKTAEAIQALFERNGVVGIDIVFTPPVP
ncbi:Tox-REase-5 domain-containing protein [Pyxidicoccus caerfyrddinensis]|uniref:Tox-REase-5 domain-containing protein n=1 Tax=Pyxidicoccus caerfyrddinensis TaxID=2709663 RepID=UPI0023DDCD5C|nr:Tox-REase-5 domain-containing protein [Pyxidicoccus caerfyrddinensis]